MLGAMERVVGGLFSQDNLPPELFEMLVAYKRETQKKDLPGLRTLAGYESAPLNKALSGFGVAIQLPKFSRPAVGVVALYRVNVRFDPPGLPDKLRIADDWYPTVIMADGPSCWMRRDQDWSPSALPVVVEIKTDSPEDRVYLIPCQQQLAGMKLLAFAQETLARRNDLTKIEAGVMFPMANLKHKPSLSQLHGLKLLGSMGKIELIDILGCSKHCFLAQVSLE